MPDQIPRDNSAKMSPELRERIDLLRQFMSPLAPKVLHAALDELVALAEGKEGWCMVPAILTPEMKRAGGHVNSEWLNDNAPIGEHLYAMPMDGVWSAILAVAPSPEGES